MPLGDLPEGLIAEISQRLHWYSTGLVRVTRENGRLDSAILIGSGTLISIEGVHGILTARHVADVLDTRGSLGLTIPPDAHNYQISAELLEVIEIGNTTDDSHGPDMAFVRLPIAELGIIKAYKSFLDLTHERARRAAKPERLDAGPWFVCGVPNAKTERARPEGGFDEVDIFHVLCGAAGVTTEYIRGEYDYYEVEVVYEGDSDIPRTFGGMSGGGLWHVPLLKTSEGTIKPKDYIFAGVVFFETGLKNQRRRIRCHGWHSIYDSAYSAIQARCS